MTIDDGLRGGGLWRPLAALYRTAIAGRAALYRAGVLRRQRVAARVVSVGNLVAGGAGKTPLVIAIAEHLVAAGQRVAVLGRGYRARGEHGVNVIAPGQGNAADPAICGDEAVLVARRVPQAAVLSGADRVRLAQTAIDRFGSQVLLLDDGFQHWRLERDVDIVVLRAPRPFGNGRLLPAGPLREPIDNLRRADLVVINRSDGPLVELLPEWLALRRSLVELAHEPAELIDLVSGAAGPAAQLHGQRVLVAVGLARPQSMVSSVQALGADVIEVAERPDHHAWSGDEVAALAQRAQQLGAALLTSEKDAVKWRSPPPASCALRLATRFISGADALWRQVEGKG